MPIYEYACPKCRVIFNFLSKRINPERSPVCPKCGNKKLFKQMSRFANLRGLKEPAAKPETEAGKPPEALARRLEDEGRDVPGLPGDRHDPARDRAHRVDRGGDGRRGREVRRWGWHGGHKRPAVGAPCCRGAG